MSSFLRNRLVFRLSSLGDVVLATSILQDGVRTDWVCAEEYAPLLRGHPAIGEVFAFSRKSGLGPWLKLCVHLAEKGYPEVIDLHGSLRTALARLIWVTRSPQTHWRKVSKERLRRLAYSVLKAKLPPRFRPTPFVERSRMLGLDSGPRGTDLSHLFIATQIRRSDYFALMPASRWPSKEWPASVFAQAVAQLASDLHVNFRILGLPSDRASAELYHECEKLGIAGDSKAVRLETGSKSYGELARTLASSLGIISTDTGLAHLAEAVGKNSFVIFGPLTPDYGFGPWRDQSQSIGKRLWCRPCSKDGRACFRLARRYACLREFSAEEALPALMSWARHQVESQR